MAIPLGAHSPKLDAVRELHSKAGRRTQGRYLVEGSTMLGEAIAAGLRPEAVFATAWGLERAISEGLDFEASAFVIPDRAMSRISEVETPPGIVAVFPSSVLSVDALLAQGKAAILLAGVADPGNAGTLLRTAEIFGIDRVVFAADGVEPHNAKVVRATMGAFFRMRIAVSDAGELIAAARRHEFALVATARTGTPLPAFRFPRKALLAVGNERRGVSDWLPSWDLSVSIPQSGRGDSLNASVAGGIIFYAFSQQFSELN
jgi:TrmH family RNA methyltransferase